MDKANKLLEVIEKLKECFTTKEIIDILEEAYKEVKGKDNK